MAKLQKAYPIGASLAAAALLSGCGSAESTSLDRFSRTGELVALSGGGAGAANGCFTCHGLDGLGNGAGAPRLAGLDFGYLQRQLIAYEDGRRHHGQMSYIADQLTPKERKAVAAYYAAMPYVPGAMPDVPAPILYARGDPERGLLACAACHGERGQGLGPANPPLGGQPAPYLAGQLERWSKSLRRTDPGDVMLRISQLLTPSEMVALADYSSRLPGGPPSLEPPEAYLATRRGGPRSDASGPPLHVPESARATE